MRSINGLLLLIFTLLTGKLFVLAKDLPARSNRVIDEKVNTLDEATKRRILAMQNAGMPKEAIAKKLSFVAGGEGTARRMLDRINLDEKRKTHAYQQKQKQAIYKSTAANKRR